MPSLYKEVLVPLQAPNDYAVTTLELDDSNGRSLSRHIRSTDDASYAEATFNSRSLATNGSIYFRQAQTYPRSFLWRVLNDDHVLEIRSVDLVKSRQEQEDATKIISLRFATRIIPTAVAFADAEGQEHIHGFVITEGKELYTFELSRDLFIGTEEITRDAFKVSIPSYFTLNRPFRLYAHNPYELFVSFENGTLQRLTRKASDDGSEWTQHIFDEKAWSLRGIVNWQGKQSVKYNGRALDYSTPLAITALSDSTHAFTVCLNHTLRVWNLTSGHLVLTKDLLDTQRTPQETPSVSLNPGANTSVKLVRLGFSAQTFVVTFSPHNEGYFKFWTVKNPLTSQLELQDAFPAASLKAPDPDPSGSSVWSMAGFDVLPTDANNILEMWVLWRNNNLRQIVNIKLNLADIERSWNNDWVQVINNDRLKKQSVEWIQNDALDPSSRWIEYILRPGNYSTPALETALAIYQEVLKFKLPSSEKKAPLAQRISSAIITTVNIRRYGGQDVGYDRFTADLEKQWQTFARILDNLQERQTAPIALAVDLYSNMPWVILSDHCAAVRECTDIELLCNNKLVSKASQTIEDHWNHRKLPEEGISEITAVLTAASSLSQKLSAEMLSACHFALEVDLFGNSELPVPARLANFYDTCNFASEVDDETYESVLKCLESCGGAAGLSSELMYMLVAKLPQSISKPESQLASTDIGRQYVSAGAQDIISLEFRLLFEVLLLIVFLDGEANAEESEEVEFDGSEMFATLHDVLREYSKKDWLASHYRTIVQGNANHLESNEKKSSEKSYNISRSLLHELFVRDIRPQPAAGIPQSFTLTKTIEDVVAWTREQDNVSFEEGLVYIQCELLLNGDVDLARDFLRYQPSTAWSTYIKGRFYLASAEFDRAAAYFQKAAHALGRGKASGDLHESSAGLLSVLEAENFYSGLPRYFQHILALFESAGSYPQVETFGRLALQSLAPHRDENDKRFTQDLLSRVFIAQIKSARYRPAFMTLATYIDPALQKSAMGTMTRAMFIPSKTLIAEPGDQLQLLQSLPLSAHQSLPSIVDRTLEDIAGQELNSSNGSHSSRLERAISLLSVQHAYRIGQQDYRGAAVVLLGQITLVRELLAARSDEEFIDVRNILLAAINALSCCSPDEAYVIQPLGDGKSSGGYDVDEMEGLEEGEPTAQPHVVTTVRELKREYQLLLDRHSRIERGDFDFGMDEDTEE